MPFFSIVIPTYNRAEFILNTLETVFGQVFTDYEVIVVDNASTDNTVALLAPLVTAGKIRFIQHDRNYERAKSRNTGMQAAQGEYLTFLDSDDLMYPQNLQAAFDFAQKNPNYKVFHNLYELVNEQYKPIYRYNFTPITHPLLQIAQGNFLSCIGVFLHRQVYKTVPWDETPVLTGSEDYEYWLRVVAQFPQIGRIAQCNSGILHHPQRTINTQQLAQAEERFVYFFQKIDQDPAFAPYGKQQATIKATLLIFLVGLAGDTAQWKKMRHYLLKTWQTDSAALFRKNFLRLLIKFVFRI